MTDKKIEEYLERAEKVAEKNQNYISRDFIEIAKMIQLEEHQREFIELNK